MTGPEAQERKSGHVLLAVSGDVHAEVSLYNGKVYFSVRRWFQADDGKWYRTKNGLHLKYDDMVEVLAQAEKVLAFGQREAGRLETVEEHDKEPREERQASGEVEY